MNNKVLMINNYKSFDCYISFAVSRPDTNKDSEGSEDEAKSSCVQKL